MAVLEHLEPKRVFGFFEQLCAIPHGSGNTKAVSDWLVAFAKERDLEVYQDALNDVIIIKEATPGYEDAEPVILQGHMDMVCETAPDCTKDMTVEGLDLAIDGDKILAKGTTLGGDDGFAVAMAMALLDASDLEHPRLEAIFTVDEETGMFGAEALDVTPLKGRRMLNLDSEEEGVFTVSCAGGVDADCILPVKREAFAGSLLSVTVGGLQGGHSGAEIHKGRGNANMVMGRVLAAIQKRTAMRLVSVAGGKKLNVITGQTTAVVTVADAEAARSACAEIENILKNEYVVTDPGVSVTVEAAESASLPMDEAATRKAVTMLVSFPYGVQVMSADIEGLVQTSLNLGVLTTSEDELKAAFSIRSSVASQKGMMVERLELLMEQLGGRVESHSDYPGWAYEQVSPLRDLMVQVFTEQYGHAPRIEAIHAGLECGLFAGKLPGLDCVSIGPDMEDIHSCRERLHISSVQRLWTMVVEVLRRMK